MTVNACVINSATFVRHPKRFLPYCVPMMPINKDMENAKSTAPGAKLLDGCPKDCKKNPNIVGASRRLWEMSDNTPAAMRMIFLYENRDMLGKRIAQKGLFFYH